MRRAAVIASLLPALVLGSLMPPRAFAQGSAVFTNSEIEDALQGDKTGPLARYLERGANPNAEQGHLLAHAAFLGSTRCIKFLIAKGANPNLKDAQGKTPLYWACVYLRRGGSPTVKALLDGGANPNIASSQGNTPLIESAAPDTEYGGEECLRAVKLLLAHGANVNARNKSGFTALDIADRMPRIAAELRKHGARTYQMHLPPEEGRVLSRIANGVLGGPSFRTHDLKDSEFLSLVLRFCLGIGKYRALHGGGHEIAIRDTDAVARDYFGRRPVRQLPLGYELSDNVYRSQGDVGGEPPCRIIAVFRAGSDTLKVLLRRAVEVDDNSQPGGTLIVRRQQSRASPFVVLAYASS